MGRDPKFKRVTAGVAGWWTKETAGESKTGGTIKIRFRSPIGDEVGKMDFDVLKLNPNKEVHWRYNWN